MRKLTSLMILMLLLSFAVSAVSAQDDPEPPAIELTPDLCDDPSNVAAIMGAMDNGGDGPSYGSVNTEQAMRMVQAPTEGPFYMVNLIKFREQAEYPDGRETDLTGREANNLYSPLEFISAVGAQPVFAGEVNGDVSDEASAWDQVGIVEYPCPLALFAMGTQPEFQATSIHKNAGLEASTIMVTHVRPFDAFDLPEVAADDTAFELVQVVRYNEEAQYSDGSDESSRTGQEAMDFYAASILEAGLTYGVYPKARLEVEGVYIGDGQHWDEVWVYYAPSQEAFDAFMADPVVVAAQYHRDAALDDAYELVSDPMVSVIPDTTLGTPNNATTAASDEPRLGFELLEIVSPTEIRAWVVQEEMTLAEFEALELPLGWMKNQPREGTVDGGQFLRSPDGEFDGDRLIEEHFGYEWLHTATVTNANVEVDEEGLLSGSHVSKYHEVYYDAGTTVPVLISPEGDVYVRIGRDAGRTTDDFTLPDGWQTDEITLAEDLVVVLPRPTLVIRTDNEDSYQGPVTELSGVMDWGTSVSGAIPVVTQTQFLRLPEDLREFRYCEVLAISLDGMAPTVDVYNTMGHNDCPADQWATLDEATIAETYGLAMARLNGPRYWVIDGIQGRGESLAGDVVDFDGLEMRWVAQINPTPSQVASMSAAFYSETEVARDTVYTYNAGTLVYELVSPDGHVYRMQSYSQQVDPTLTLHDLENLGNRLDLTEGWRFQTSILAEDEYLSADGVAVVVTDELNNTYQLLAAETIAETTFIPGPNDTGLYTTVNAAEHADDGRSHVFEYATFDGSFDEDATNTTVIRTAPGFYPGAYNVVTRNENEIFVYYGVYGEVEGTTGPAVARLDADTLEEVWNTQLAVYENETAWNYPGVVQMHGNGTLIVISGNTAAVIDPDTGDIINQVDLAQDDPLNGSYNGFVTTSDGTLFTKALFRNCDDAGSVALASCLDTDVTQLLLALDPVTLEILDQVELPDFSTGRVPTAVHDGIDYVYMPGINFSYRYRWEDQALTLDEEWGFVSITEEGDLGAMAPNVVGDWVFVQINKGTNGPMPVYAISVNDPSERFLIQPFEDIQTRFSFGVAHGAYDPVSNLYFTADTGAGYVGAMRFDPESGFETVWLEEQTTSVFQQLIGTSDERVIVTSELTNFPPGLRTPLNTLDARNEQVVFRDAATGRELARTEDLPRMTQGSNISPGFDGRVYFVGVDGVLYEITVESN